MVPLAFLLMKLLRRGGCVERQSPHSFNNHIRISLANHRSMDLSPLEQSQMKDSAWQSWACALGGPIHDRGEEGAPRSIRFGYDDLYFGAT